MKALYLLIIIYIAIVATGCSSLSTGTLPSPSNKTSSTPPTPQKNPLNVALYLHETPQQPFVVIGHETISKYNLGGIKRQEAYLHDTMRNLAASVGGDAVMNVKHDNNNITATIIAFSNKQVV